MQFKIPDRMKRQSFWTAVAVAAGSLVAAFPALAPAVPYVGAVVTIAKLFLPEDSTKQPPGDGGN